LLAWFEEGRDFDPIEEADHRALTPASGVLIREVDDEVEKLRKIAKQGGREGAIAKTTIENRLREGALREWALTINAREAFWNLRLNHTPTLQKLVDASFKRVSYSF